MTATLVLLRHGQSLWNAENRFTGWWDTDLSSRGEQEAAAAGALLAGAGITPTVVHTSLLTRAIRTAELALHAQDLAWLPVRRHWRLNERHYGDLTGKNKAETAATHGAEKVKVWRRSYDVPPPPIATDNAFNPNGDARYASLAPELVPATECLADVVARMLPYWFDSLTADLGRGEVPLVVAHGNSIRALVKHLDTVTDDAITSVEIPTGVPLVYELDAAFHPVTDKPLLARALGDPDTVKAAAIAVANQATRRSPG